MNWIVKRGKDNRKQRRNVTDKTNGKEWRLRMGIGRPNT
jgi:hypothetical protein